ncbi:MAG: hypothetical protein AAF907_12040, partial [Planctomycetota bacterium]
AFEGHNSILVDSVPMDDEDEKATRLEFTGRTVAKPDLPGQKDESAESDDDEAAEDEGELVGAGVGAGGEDLSSDDESDD